MFVRCSSCSKNISHRAPMCPFCGAPNDKLAEKPSTDVPTAPEPTRAGQAVTQFCDHGAVAEEAVREFQISGFSLDYTVASTATLDLLISDRYGGEGLGCETETWRPSAEHRKVIAMVGSYVGEVIRAKYSGDWTDDPDHPGKPLFVQLDLGVSGVVWPLERAYRRLKNGETDSLLNYMELVQNEVTGGSDLGLAMDWASQASDFIKKDRLDVARTFIERAIAIEPQHAEAWFCRGLVNERLGKKVEATFGYEQSLRFGEHRDRGFRAHLRDKIEFLRKTSVSELAAQATEQPWTTGNYPTSTPEADVATTDDGGAKPDDGVAKPAQELKTHFTTSEPTIGDGAAPEISSPDGEDTESSRPRNTSGSLAVPPAEQAHPRAEQTDLEKVFGTEAFASTPGSEEEDEDAAKEGKTDDGDSRTPESPFITDAVTPISVRPSGPLPVKKLAASGVQTPLSLADSKADLPKVEEDACLGEDEPKTEAPPQLGNTLSVVEQTEPHPEALALTQDASSLMSRARFEEASVCFREAIGLSPSLDSARVGSAVAYLALAKPTEAMAVLEPLIKRQDPQAIVLAGRILSTDDRFEDAVAVIGAAILTHPKSAGLHSARGQHLFSLGRFAAAAAAFEKALQHDSADPSSWFGLASAVVKLDDEKRARLALAGYLGIAHPADVARVRFAQRELTRLAVK